MVRDPGKNNYASAGAYFDLLPDVQEEDTEFFVRQARGEFRQDEDTDAEFFEMTMAILENAGYEHYEVSNYARPGFESVHNRACTGWVKIIWESDRARFRPLACSAGKMSAIIEPTSIGCFPENQHAERAKI